MNKHTLEGKWKQLRGKVQERWDRLSDFDLSMINGQTDALAGILQAKYGYTRDQAEQEIDQFIKEVDGKLQSPVLEGQRR